MNNAPSVSLSSCESVQPVGPITNVQRKQAMYRREYANKVSIHAVSKRLRILERIQSRPEFVYHVDIKKRHNVNVARMLLSRSEATINPLNKMHIAQADT